MIHQIGIREANLHLSRYIAAVERGEEVIITRRGRPVARLMPVPKKRKLTPEQEAAWARLRARMQKGYDLGIGRIDRESLHERRPRDD
ncbi:MAG: type II toxin-antitoxin system Phd/YefM family antitoxin [Kiloniellales bacterium]